MRAKNILRTAQISLTVSLLAPSGAFADTVDYGSLQALFGEPVTTSATGTPQRASDVAANMTIITADQIRQSGSRDIPVIINQYVPGIDLLQTGENSFDVGVRGYQQAFQPRLLVLVDGRQVFLDDYSRTIWANIPVNIDDIRQIEVVKGASSALFGSNAAGGVVNIVTYSPIYDNNRVASASIGNDSARTLDATATAKWSDTSGIKISAGGVNADEFNSGHTASDAYSNGTMSRYVVERSDVQIVSGLQANSEATYSESRANPAQVAFETDAEQTENYSVKGGLSWQSPVGLISNNNYVNHTAAHAVGVNFDNGSITELVVSQLEDQFKIGTDNAFRIAAEYRHKYYQGTAAQAFAQSPSIDQNVYSLSGAWLSQLNNKLSWTNALRFDHQNSTQTGTLFADALENNALYSHVINTWSGNSGLAYKVTDIDTLRATYGRGIQLPGLIPEGLNDVGQTGANTYFDVEGNPALKPTIVQNYELGYDRTVAEIFSTAKFSAFYEKDQDIIGFDASSFFNTVGPNTYQVIQSANVGSSQSVGGEFELKGTHNGFRWDGSYSYARVEDTAEVAQFVGYEGSVPQHHFRLLGGYTTGPWEFDANGQYLSSTKMLRALVTSSFVPVSTQGYATLGGRIGYNVNDHVTVALSGNNITRSQTDASPYPEVERQIFLTLTGKF
jgi:outer membrane receptor for ferrienterochelin and colicins